MPREAQTDATGAYKFAGVRPGKYTVRVALPGFSPLEKAVEVAAGSTVTADASLVVALETQKITVKERTLP